MSASSFQFRVHRGIWDWRDHVEQGPPMEPLTSTEIAEAPLPFRDCLLRTPTLEPMARVEIGALVEMSTASPHYLGVCSTNYEVARRADVATRTCWRFQRLVSGISDVTVADSPRSCAGRDRTTGRALADPCAGPLAARAACETL